MPHKDRKVEGERMSPEPTSRHLAHATACAGLGEEAAESSQGEAPAPTPPLLNRLFFQGKNGKICV